MTPPRKTEDLRIVQARHRLGYIGSVLADLRPAVLEIAAAGVPITEIHQKLGLARSTIHRWIREAGDTPAEP